MNRALVLCAAVAACLAVPQAVWAFPTMKRNIVYSQPAEGVTLTLDAYLPEGAGPFPAVLVVHGGSWRSGSKEQLGLHAWAMANSGYACFAINYRLAPEHPWPAQIHDCKQAVRWIREHAEEYRVDPERVGAFGYSAGGQLVALLGTSDANHGLEGADAEGLPSTRIQAVCAGGAPVEFRNLPPRSRGFAFWLGGTPAELPAVYEQASPAAFVSADDPPMLFYHGTSDRMVRVKPIEEMMATLKKQGVPTELKLIEGAGHIGAALNPRTVGWALEFFDQHLAPQAEPPPAERSF